MMTRASTMSMLPQFDFLFYFFPLHFPLENNLIIITLTFPLDGLASSPSTHPSRHQPLSRLETPAS